MRLGMTAVALSCALVIACGGGDPHGDDAPADAAVTPPGKTCGSPVMAVDTTMGATVVGDGTPASCTQAALVAAIAGGGTITFSCGTAPVTIAITTTLELRTDVDTTIDGAKLVTLDGGGTTRILSFDHPNYRVNTVTLTLQHLTLAHGRARGTKMYLPAPAPCSQGYYDGAGGALNFRDGKLVVIGTVFDSNQAASLGPDVGGGAIAILGALDAIIADSVFTSNKGSNSGAIYALNSQLDVYDSRFDGNEAQGNGANSDDATKCSVVADTNQHQVGSGGNGGAIGIDGGDDTTHTFCGVQFTNNKSGVGALGGALARTPDAGKQTTVIDRCTFDGNTGDTAAATYFHNSKLVITASSFVNNTATRGSGAIQADGTDFEFLNTTFANNTAMAGLGGALSLFGGGGSIKFSTFVDNQANGGDPYFGAAIGGNPTLTLVSNLFVNNVANNPGAPMQCHVTGTGDGNLQWPPTHSVGAAPDAKCTPTTLFVDPVLGALGDHGGASPTVVPTGAAAISAGVDCPPTDQIGKARPAIGCTSGSMQVDI